jgi:hypothetical protein
MMMGRPFLFPRRSVVVVVRPHFCFLTPAAKATYYDYYTIMSTTSSQDATRFSDGGAIVVVAKCPIPGKSKTRLIPLLGEKGSTQLAKAMLSDVLLTLDKCVSRKKNLLFYG